MERAVNVAAPLYISNLTKVYRAEQGDVRALRDVSLTVHPGEFLAIVGASGCGKSTLLRLIAGLDTDFRGSIRLGNEVIRGVDVNRGMIFQEARLFAWLTVAQNIAFGLVGKYAKREKAAIVERHIRLMGLEGFGKAYPHQLSGGMQQRVSIARALVNKPKILTLDEPFGALDALTRLQMQQEILQIRESEKTTMILVTHDIDEAVYLADRVIVLSSRPGTVKAAVTVDIPRPRDRNSIEFVSLKREIYVALFDKEVEYLDYVI
ncbi:MAG: ABC transporter ATP-binding protein [Tannerella sp.]|jgi:sulfonate transport system ATP-binding protein|nr:ABC transporter ATP-binding protein [Tannerella sp.]